MSSLITYCHDAHFDESNRSRIVILIAIVVVESKSNLSCNSHFTWTEIAAAIVYFCTFSPNRVELYSEQTQHDFAAHLDKGRFPTA